MVVDQVEIIGKPNVFIDLETQRVGPENIYILRVVLVIAEQIEPAGEVDIFRQFLFEVGR